MAEHRTPRTAQPVYPRELKGRAAEPDPGSRVDVSSRRFDFGPLRRRLFGLPGRLTRSARRLTLHLPVDWPWADEFASALGRPRQHV